jgi:hypothetical protein
LAILLSRVLAGGDAAVPIPPEKPSFVDVPPRDLAFRHVEHLAANGILGELAEGLFHPEQWLSRGGAAIFVARACLGRDDLLPPGPAQPTFPDVRPGAESHYSHCFRHVEYLAARGALRALPDGLCHPERNCSQAELVAMLVTAFGLDARGKVTSGPSQATAPSG